MVREEEWYAFSIETKIAIFFADAELSRTDDLE